MKVSVTDAKARLSEFIKRAEKGETIVLTRRNHPFAELRSISATKRVPRPMGLCAGEFEVPADFDEALP